MDPKPVPEVPLPVCPYCLSDSGMLSARGPIQIGNYHAVIIYCGTPECRKIWTVDIVKALEPRVQGVQGIIHA